ncbi:MAG TPA: lyase [Thermoanaerobaculia bacterium]|nr:lyase [Thermoanaerobaculia bacterium]
MIPLLLAVVVNIHEYTVPWKNTRPRDPAVGANGRIWFVGQEGNYLGWVDASSGKFEKFDLEKGTGPHNCIVARDGEVWFAGNAAAYIGRFDPKTEKVTKYPMPDQAARDPHTLIEAADGTIWFTVQVGSFVGHLDPKSGDIRLVKIPTAGSRPYGIAIDSSSRVWFNEFGRNAIGSIDPKTMQLTEYSLPQGTRDRRIAIIGDGAIWYGDYARGRLGRLDPKTKEVKEWPTPSGASSLPYAMAVDDRSRIWIVESGPQPNRLVGFDPKTSAFFSNTPIPSGAQTVRNMVFDPHKREIWFGTDAGTIGRASVP